jgi:superfamily II DNA or RNA helicase
MWKALKPLVDRAVYAWGMTGTPTPQGPMDAFGQCRMLVPDKVPRNKNQWQDMTMIKFSQFRWGVRENGWKTVQQAMQPAIRFEKKDVLKHLPPVTYRYVHVPLTASQEAYYAKLRDEMVAEAGAHTISAVHAGAKMIKLMQVASGAVYDDNGTALEFDVSPRIKVLKELIDQTSEGVLVFAPFLHTVAMLEKHLAPLGFKTITGETSLAERTKTISSLQAGEIKGILAIPQTLSHGVTLTAANLSIWFSCPSSTETYLQASNRMDRPGQKHAMQIIHLFGSQVERKRYDAVKNNDEAQNSMLDLYQAFVQGI